MTMDTNSYGKTRNTNCYGKLRDAFWFITSKTINICIINFKPKKKKNNCLKKFKIRIEENKIYNSRTKIKLNPNFRNQKFFSFFPKLVER